ncbi:hypothetical protein NDU88_002301 [Pleurodeles waltl]|uniref:Uncharacterized protein n=1 Tax=Pleurodeles waltl TaxID=8319 RepID=A0AAV7P9L2_PLEWA|nr:hypothetical protein NDU88_002301 [Pleurodeles waltl]
METAVRMLDFLRRGQRYLICVKHPSQVKCLGPPSSGKKGAPETPEAPTPVYSVARSDVDMEMVGAGADQSAPDSVVSTVRDGDSSPVSVVAYDIQTVIAKGTALEDSCSLMLPNTRSIVQEDKQGESTASLVANDPTPTTNGEDDGAEQSTALVEGAERERGRGPRRVCGGLGALGRREGGAQYGWLDGTSVQRGDGVGQGASTAAPDRIGFCALR